jgi:hypothetical protein
MALKPFEKLSKSTHGWGKQDNWRIAREMELDDFEGSDLYEFLYKL